MKKPVIGILGLTAKLYKDKFPDYVKDLEKKYKAFIRESFKSVEIAEFCFAYEKTMVEKAYKRMLDLDVDGIVIVFFSYSPSMIVAPVIEKNEIPILLWNTQQLFKIGKNFSVSDMMYNHGMHGVQDLSCVLLRKGVPFTIITGHYTQQDTLSNLSFWCKGVAILKELRRLKAGRIGGVFKDMGDFSIPDTIIGNVLGTEIIDIKMTELKKEAQNISKKALREVMDQEEKNFKIEVDKETRAISARMELALRNLIKRYGLQAIALNFMSFKGEDYCESIPFSAISKLISEGIGYGGEGDILCAISVWILRQIAGQSTFTEMFTTDYKNNRIFMSHMGESNYMMAKNRKQIRLIKKDMNIAAPGTFTTMLYFQMKPGKVTLFNLAPSKEKKFNIIVAKGQIEDKALFRQIQSPHFLLKLNGDVREFLNVYSTAGGTHHLAMAYGDHVQCIKTFAHIARFQFIEIQ
ncbi:MAG: hypothetical protein NC913_00350 [Candidatus Omnitrophica bacterium]|nr:hypothetical protein [Candidatus Omnitrophota bacterium]